MTIQPYIGTNETYGSKAFTFDGKMIMHITCKKDTNKIVFHQENLAIDEKNVVVAGLALGAKMTFSYDPERVFTTINLDSNLVSGKNYTLTVPYTGKILSNLFGFYKGSYIENGKTY